MESHPNPSSARAIFERAIEIATADERQAYLNEAFADRPEMREKVQALLAAYAAAGDFLESPATSAVSPAAPPPVNESLRERAGTVVGAYKLLEQIGEGGMAVVFLAEQTRPIQRKVALKVIKPGMDSAQVISRFDAERQALALMDHPNIAKVFEAGTSESGRPYFVMELVKGVPITRYCDEHRLTPRRRLGLFVQVCSAVQHAHTKGIIHRDLKPSNVLVALYDGKPVPKVIDFGIAKATGQPLTDQTMFTGFGAVVGTPEYMSPEQAELNQLDIDTRSDIYSLGVLLYELLTGSTPLEHNRFKAAALLEMLRVVREEEPPKPSTRLGTSEFLATIAANRGLEPKKLSGLVRGELDWIVMKALEKDRGRRYETANGFATDVQRYLDDEAVQACPASARYRFVKFARRNKAALVTGLLVVAALLAGTGVATWQAVVATRANRAALAAAAAEGKAKDIAEAREAETQAVLDFVENKVFAAARPEGQAGGQGRDVTLRSAVEAALPFVEQSFTKEPLIEARLRRTLGTSFLYLGEAGMAADQYRRARALYTKQLGPDHPDTLRSIFNLANSYADLGQNDEALKLHEETLALQRAKLGRDHLDTLWSMMNVATDYGALGRFPDALQLNEQTLALLRAKLGPDDPATLMTMSNLAVDYSAVGRYAEALKLHEQTLALRKAKLGPDHRNTLTSMHHLAASYHDLGRYTEALKLSEEELALRKAKLGADHPDTLKSMHNLANYYADLGRHTEALKLLEQIVALRKAKLGPDHSDTLMSMSNLASSYRALGRDAEALKLNEETLALQKAKLGPDHPDTLRSMHNLANCYADLGRHDEALTLRQETLALQKAKLGPDHPETLGTMASLASSYAALGRHADALTLDEQTLALRTSKLGPDHPDTLRSMNNLANSYDAVGRDADALKLHEETLALRKTKLGADHPETLLSMEHVAESLVKLDRGAEAVPIIDECVHRSLGKDVYPPLIPKLMHLRLRHFAKTLDAAGCRATAEMWEQLKFADSDSLYDAACNRAVTASVIRATDKSEAAAKQADAEADRAMGWLTRAVAAGEKDVEDWKTDADLDALRSRDDFRALMKELESKAKANEPPSTRTR